MYSGDEEDRVFRCSEWSAGSENHWRTERRRWRRGGEKKVDREMQQTEVTLVKV